LPRWPREVEVSAVREEEFETLLPLISAYQRFYEVEDVDPDRNRFFFRRFLAPSEDGLLLAARDEGGVILGYACLYWHFSSLQALETVADERPLRRPGGPRPRRRPGPDRGDRRGGTAGAAPPGSSGRPPPDNHTAQRLYDSLTDEKSTWLSYELEV